VSSSPQRRRGPEELASINDLEELDHEAILAHEQAPHAPQKRAQVQEEERSIVISEPRPRLQSYGSGRGEATIVLTDRKDLEAARRRILSKRRRRGASRKVIWLGFALGAFFVGGVIALSLRKSAPKSEEPITLPEQTVVNDAPADQATSASVPTLRAVPLEQLPLESAQPRARSAR